jgi:hypothetical protein
MPCDFAGGVISAAGRGTGPCPAIWQRTALPHVYSGFLFALNSASLSAIRFSIPRSVGS